MRNNSFSNQSIPEVFMQGSTTKQDNSISNPQTNAEAKIAELENEREKQKAFSEKGAKLMQMIWGDNFQSDSLH